MVPLRISYRCLLFSYSFRNFFQMDILFGSTEAPREQQTRRLGWIVFRQTFSNFPGDFKKSECVQHWCASRNRWRSSSALWRHRWRLNHHFQDPHPFPAAVMFCSASLFPSALLLLLLLLVTLFQPSGRLYRPPISLISGLFCEHFTLPIFFSLFSSQSPPSLQCALCVFSFLCVFLLCTQRCLFLCAQDPKITLRVCVINCLN